MKLDADPRLPMGADVGRLVQRLYEVLRLAATAINRHEDGYVASVVSVTSNYVVQGSVGVLLVDATAGAVIVALQAPGEAKGKRLSVRKTDATANNVFVGAPTGLINGAATLVLTAAAPSCTFVSDGTNHFTV